MSDLVADASAVVDLLTGAAGGVAVGRALADVAEIHVPEHFHVEVLAALRGMARGAAISDVHADRAIDALADLRAVRHPVLPLARAVWDLRDRLTAYDAAYLALADALDLSLISNDRVLSAAARSAGRLYGTR